MKELNGDTAASTSKTLGEAWELWIADSEANGLEMSTVRPRRQLLTHWWAEACRTQHSPALSVRGRVARCWPFAGHAAQGHGARQDLHLVRAGARLCCTERRPRRE